EVRHRRRRPLGAPRGGRGGDRATRPRGHESRVDRRAIPGPRYERSKESRLPVLRHPEGVAAMTLPAPNLDDRRFQDLVEEAKRLIPIYCPDWTDHSLSDPGIALVELFAWMTEMILYRLNQVPDKHYVKFLELMGISLFPPEPAKVDLAFWLVAPVPTP